MQKINGCDTLVGFFARFFSISSEIEKNRAKITFFKIKLDEKKSCKKYLGVYHTQGFFALFFFSISSEIEKHRAFFCPIFEVSEETEKIVQKIHGVYHIHGFFARFFSISSEIEKNRSKN